MFKRNLDSKCKVQNDSIKSKNVRNKKIAIDKQKINTDKIYISYSLYQ